MKRFATILLALVMILSLAVPAFAAEGNTITVNNAKPGETYKLYKMFDLKVDNETDPKAYTYTVNSLWADFFKAPDASNDVDEGPGYQYITVNAAGAVTEIKDKVALAKAAAAWTGKPNATDSVTVAEGATTVVFAGLENGYWLITSTLGTFAMTETTPDKAAVTINEKNPVNSITKQVKEDETWGAENDAQIGDKVEFQSVITLNKGTRNVKVTDTMTSGLTYNKDAVIAGLTKDTEYTIEETDTGFVITFKDDYINNLADGTTTLTLTYSATLNKNAVAEKAIVEQTNTIVISYGDEQSVEAKTTTTTHKFNVYKHAAGSTDNLAGAVFSLKKNGEVVKLIKIDDTNYRVAMADENGVDTFITVASGDIVIWGVDTDGVYTLKETEAPIGYNELTEEATVNVAADNATRVDVENKTGSELPDTGGVGTTMFYLFGGIMVLAAVVLLVTKKRMTNVE